jgi:hypothetical protein
MHEKGKRGHRIKSASRLDNAALSLTPALSRWEREKRSPRQSGAAALETTTRTRGCPLSQRERVRVRENGPGFTSVC